VSEEPMPIGPGSSVHQEAAEWVENEEGRWPPSPSRPMQTSQLTQQAMSQYPPVGSMQAQSPQRWSAMQGVSAAPQEPVALGATQQAAAMGGAGGQWSYPSFLDSIPREVPPPMPSTTNPSSPPPLVLDVRPPRQEKQKAAPGVAAEGQQSVSEDFGGQVRPKPPASGAPSTGRPVPGRTTRAHRIAARKEAASAGAQAGAAPPAEDPQRLQQFQLLRRTAADRIQRVWRARSKQLRDNRERAKREKAAATKIQAVWRAYHVRRKKKDKAATMIQRNVRGWLVRLALKRHNAAVVIQRHVLGLLVRRNMKQFNKATTAIQRVARGKRARRKAEQRKK